MHQEAPRDGEDPGEAQMRQQASKRRGKHRFHRSEADAVREDEAMEEEATVKLDHIQHHRGKLQRQMLHNQPAAEEGADERVVEDRGLAHGWLLVDANSVDN